MNSIRIVGAAEQVRLQRLRVALRIAADDLRDLEARIHYRGDGQDTAFQEARRLAETLKDEIRRAGL